PAHHLTSADDELVGSSTGLPFQRFRLAHAPVAVGSVRVEVTAPGGTVETFEEVPDLFAAGPGDKVFALLPATGEILFGSRTFGAIPPPDDSGVGGNIRASYQHGGGRRGNVGAGALSQVASPAGVGQLDGTNLLPALGGDDEETAAEGVVRAPAVVRSRYRPVSESDFSALARETPNVRVARALTLPNSRPGLVPGTSPGAVTVVLVPNAPFAETLRKPIPLPSHVASAVLRYLDGRRLVTTQVFVREAEFRQITVDTTLTVEAGSGLLDARTAATDTLLRHFHPLVGGRTGDGWPFGGTAEHSTIFERLLRTEGVARVEELKIRLDDGPWLECEDVPVGAGELLYSGEHIVRIAGAG
ncbi:MAG: putative baseplate assembly protein, partial [Myxococcota bacterium]